MAQPDSSERFCAQMNQSLRLLLYTTKVVFITKEMLLRASITKEIVLQYCSKHPNAFAKQTRKKTTSPYSFDHFSTLRLFFPIILQLHFRSLFSDRMSAWLKVSESGRGQPIWMCRLLHVVFALSVSLGAISDASLSRSRPSTSSWHFLVV